MMTAALARSRSIEAMGATFLRDWIGGHSALSEPERRGSDSAPVVCRLLQSHIRNLTSTTETSAWNNEGTGWKSPTWEENSQVHGFGYMNGSQPVIELHGARQRCRRTDPIF